MAQTIIKCDKCGENMYMDSTRARGICPNCNYEKPLMAQDMLGTEYKIESFGDPTELLAKAEAYFDLQDYDRAAEFFAKGINVDPNDYKGWWGVTRCRVVNNYLGIDNGYAQAFEKVKSLAPEEIVPELEIKYGVYLEALLKRKEKSDKLECGNPVSREITIKASKGPEKPYTTDIIVSVFLACLGIVTIVLAVTLGTRLRLLFIILSVMLGLGSVYMFKHIGDSKKIVKMITNEEVTKVSELMEVLKRKDKHEFLKTIGSMIVAKYLVDYKIVDAEHIIKAQCEEDYAEDKISKAKQSRKDKKEKS